MESPEKIKVAFISGAYPPIRDGIGFYLKRLVAHLKGVEYKVITSKGAEQNPHILAKVSTWGAGLFGQIKPILVKQQPDLIHLQYGSTRYGKKLAISFLPHRLRQVFRQTPQVITIHEYHDASWLGCKRVEVFIRPVQNIIVSNKSDKEQLSKRFPSKNFHMIPIGSNIEFAKFSPAQLTQLSERYNSEKKKLILTWGLLDEGKGVEELVDAMRKLGSHTRLLIASGFDAENPFHRRLKQYIQDTKADIAWLGFLDDREISGLLQISDLVVLPFGQPVSLRRGSVLAAIAHGKVVITTGPSDDKQLQDRKNCYLLTNNQPQTIVDAIKELFADQKLATLIAMQASELAKQFNWEEIAARHEELYKELLSKPQN